MCFDECHRIDIEVLNVVAQQLLKIKNAKDIKATKFIFEGREIRLTDTCCAFITMNRGYAGRTELPDNLKVLFRPISMMIPGIFIFACDWALRQAKDSVQACTSRAFKRASPEEFFLNRFLRDSY